MPWMDAGRALQLDLSDYTDLGATDRQEPQPDGPCSCAACHAGRMADLEAAGPPIPPPRRRAKRK